NGLKALKGRHEALADKDFFGQLQKNESDFRAKVAANPALLSEYGDVWDNIAALTKKRQEMRKSMDAVQSEFGSTLVHMARAIVRHAEEKTKPNGERLPEFTDARLPQMEQRVLSNAPIYKEFEIANLRNGLTWFREELGPDHPLVKRLLGNKNPEQVANDLVLGTKLFDLTMNKKGEATGGLRKTLWDADSKTLAASNDPMIKFVASYDTEVRALRKKFEEEVEGPQKKQEERLAQARFAVYGTDIYPDATFTLRLSYGRVVGWNENGTPVAPFTDIAGAYARNTGAEPFALPKSWLAAKDKVNLQTPLNFVTNNDIIGGNSGSPMVNKNGEVIGLIFDGNIHSLGGEFGFDGKVNRSVAVDTRALLEALDHVYPAARIATEIRSGQK
ncbi:MAG: S46 family peptidase, partial [Rhodoferax sp.]